MDNQWMQSNYWWNKMNENILRKIRHNQCWQPNNVPVMDKKEKIIMCAAEQAVFLTTVTKINHWQQDNLAIKKYTVYEHVNREFKRNSSKLSKGVNLF